MRIIAGEFKGRRLAEPGKLPLRPTSDRLRETLFNVLGPLSEDTTVLDGFAGTGALGLEALSRGARSVTFVESNRRVVEVLRENIATFGVEGRCDVEPRDFLGAWNVGTRHREPRAFELILLDPPYDVKDLSAVLGTAAPALAPGGTLVLEHSKRRETPAVIGALSRVRLLVAGDSALSFYQPS